MFVGDNFHNAMSNCGEMVGSLCGLVICFGRNVVGERLIVPDDVSVVGGTTVGAGVSLYGMLVD